MNAKANTPPQRTPLVILGVPFDVITAEEAAQIVAAMVASRRPHYLATADARLVEQATEDAELRRALLDAHLVMGADPLLRWASKLLGNLLPEEVSNQAFAWQLLSDAARNGWRVFFLGSSEASLARTLEETQAAFPQLHAAGAYTPKPISLSEAEQPELVLRIRGAEPDLLLVSLGSPLQEKWTAMHYRKLKVPVTFGLQPIASVEQITGTADRGGLLRHPKVAFTRAVVRQAWQLRARRRNVRNEAGARLRVVPGHALLLLHLPARLTAETVQAGEDIWARALATRGHLVADLSGITDLDSTGLGLLVRLQKTVRANGHNFGLLAPSPSAQKALTLVRLQDAFPTFPHLEAATDFVSQRASEAVVVVTMGYPRRDEPLAWQGEVTAGNVEEVWRMTEPHLFSPSVAQERLTINLAELRFVDSAGVGLMVRIRKYARRNGVDVKFASPPPDVRSVIRQLQLEAFLLRF